MQDDFSFSPLQNGLEFLLSSLEHLTAASSTPPSAVRSSDHKWAQKRHLKYALLHVCSSVEVLFKVRLRNEHWSLVYANVNKADDSAQDGEVESVAFADLMNRLVRICKVNLSEQDRKQLLALRKRRNCLEHFGTVDSLLAVMASVTTTVGFIVDFAQSCFSKEALEEERCLLNAIRKQLGDCRAFIDHRWKAIRADVKLLALVVECPACQQHALGVVPGVILCRFCHYQSSPPEAAREYLASAGARHIAMSAPAGPDDMKKCAVCQYQTLVLDVTTSKMFCFSCGDQWLARDVSHCLECAAILLTAPDGASCCPNCD